MDLSPFKLDIDELINEFAEGQSTMFADMKRVWLSRKFSYIFEASHSSNLEYFVQTLYGHSIGYMINGCSLSHRLGGLYCLYCLYETQPFKPPIKIYVSLGELKKLRNLVVDAKENGIKVVCTLIKRMLEMKVFLFGFVDINEDSELQRINELTESQNSRVQTAYNMLLANSRVEQFLHMDLGMELDLKELKKISTEYAEAKTQAIKGASEVMDMENLKPILETKNMIEERLEKVVQDWNAQKQVFNQQSAANQPRRHQEQLQQAEDEYEDMDDFNTHLEMILTDL